MKPTFETVTLAWRTGSNRVRYRTQIGLKANEISHLVTAIKAVPKEEIITQLWLSPACCGWRCSSAGYDNNEPGTAKVLHCIRVDRAVYFLPSCPAGFWFRNRDGFPVDVGKGPMTTGGCFHQGGRYAQTTCGGASKSATDDGLPELEALTNKLAELHSEGQGDTQEAKQLRSAALAIVRRRVDSFGEQNPIGFEDLRALKNFWAIYPPGVGVGG